MAGKRDWVQVLTNIAVVIGLLLLIYELNQSRDLTRTQVVDSVYNAAVSRNLALLGESPEQAVAKSIFRPDQLTEAEAVVLSQFYTSVLVSWLRNKDERGLGYFDESFESVIASEVYHINTVPGRLWWASIREFADPDIADVVDRELAKVGPEAQRQMLLQIVGEGSEGP